MHLSPAGQSPRQAGNGPVHGINAVLVVVLLVVVRVVVVCGGRVLVVGGRVVVLTVVEVVGGRVVVVAGSVLVVGGRVVLVGVVEVVDGRVVVVGAGCVFVVGGRVALVVVVEVVVVDVVLPGQTKRRPLSCSAVATVASRSASREPARVALVARLCAPLTRLLAEDPDGLHECRQLGFVSNTSRNGFVSQRSVVEDGACELQMAQGHTPCQQGEALLDRVRAAKVLSGARHEAAVSRGRTRRRVDGRPRGRVAVDRPAEHAR